MYITKYYHKGAVIHVANTENPRVIHELDVITINGKEYMVTSQETVDNISRVNLASGLLTMDNEDAPGPATITPKEPELVWNPLDSNMGCFYRAKVPGGWLIMSECEVQHDRGGYMQSGYDWRTSITFVPDPLGVWGS